MMSSFECLIRYFTYINNLLVFVHKPSPAEFSPSHKWQSHSTHFLANYLRALFPPLPLPLFPSSFSLIAPPLSSSSFKVILESSVWNSLLQTFLWITSWFLWEIWSSVIASEKPSFMSLHKWHLPITTLCPSSRLFFFDSTYQFIAYYLFVLSLSIFVSKVAWGNGLFSSVFWYILKPRTEVEIEQI